MGALYLSTQDIRLEEPLLCMIFCRLNEMQTNRAWRTETQTHRHSRNCAEARNFDAPPQSPVADPKLGQHLILCSIVLKLLTYHFKKHNYPNSSLPQIAQRRHFTQFLLCKAHAIVSAITTATITATITAEITTATTIELLHLLNLTELFALAGRLSVHIILSMIFAINM